MVHSPDFFSRKFFNFSLGVRLFVVVMALAEQRAVGRWYVQLAIMRSFNVFYFLLFLSIPSFYFFLL